MKRTLLALSLGARPPSRHPQPITLFLLSTSEEQKISIEGDVIAFELKNPHAWLHLAVVDEGGNRQSVSAEWSNPARLKSAGFSVDSFKPGDHLILTGSPARNPAEYRIHLRTIQPAGRWLEMAEKRPRRRPLTAR